MNQPVKHQHETDCPSRDDLKALLGGSLDERHEESIELHVATCELCGQTLEEMCQIDDADRWQKLAGESPASLTKAPVKPSDRIEPARLDISKVPSIEGFEILGIAGKGGMGVVYKARQLSLNRVVAIKMLHSTAPDDLERLDRFKKEADSIARIQHPNVISIYEINEHEGIPYIVLEFIHGPNLSRLIKKSAPFENFSAAQLVQKLALAVDAAHSQNLIHRDLKPANIMLQLRGTDSDSIVAISDIPLNEFEPRVTDFGLAKSFEYDNKTQTSLLVGTPSYMSPEQITCPDDWVKPAVDVYALGVILYEMLTGKLPFTAKSTFELFKKIETHDPAAIRTLNRDVEKDLEAICLKCLEKSPLARYESAKYLADDLERYLRRQPVTARKATIFKRIGKWAVRNKMQLALASLVLLALVVFGSLLLNVRQQRQAALNDYEDSIQKANLLFQDAQESEWRNLESWDEAQNEIARAVEFKTEHPQLISAEDALELSESIEFHRSARVFIRDVDDLLLEKFLEYYLPLNPSAFSEGVKSAISFLESGGSQQNLSRKLRTLDESTSEGVIATIYRILLHDSSLSNIEKYEQLVDVLDASQWRKSAYQAIKSKRIEEAKLLIDQPDLNLSPHALADFLAALHLNGSVSYQRVAESLKDAQYKIPSSFWLNYQLHWFTRRYQHPSNAIPSLRAALAERDLPAMRLLLGHLFREIREFEQAEKEFMAVLDKEPENIAVYRLLAACYRSAKQYDKAIENFRIAIEVEPERDFIRGNLLSTYVEAGQKEAARNFANELVQRESLDHETFHSKAIAYTKLGKLDLAAENYKLAVDADPNCLKCLMELANVYLRQQKLDEARAELAKLLDARPNIVTSLKLMMNICIAQKDYEAAEKYAKQRLEMSPRAPGYMSDLADIYVKSGKFDLAEEAYLKSQSFIQQDDEDNIDKDNVYALEQLAIMYNSQKKLDFAESTARRAIRIRPHAEQANFLLVQILCKQDRVDDALEAAYTYKENAPKSVYAQTSILNTLILMKRYEEAIKVFELGQELDSQPPQVFTESKLEQLKKQAEENDTGSE